MRTRMRNNYVISLSILSCLLFATYLPAQVLTAESHIPCRTDSFLIYKVPYISVADSGRNCIWDFSNISTDSAEIITVDYYRTSSVDTLRYGMHREHANYYYRYAQDTLWMTGYETSHTNVQYTSPLPCLRFPFAYGDSLCGIYSGKGQYCHRLPLALDGSYVIFADAKGRLVLPDMTVDSVLRVHSQILYKESIYNRNYKENHYQWYSPYCRYPLFETVQTQAIEGKDTIIFATSYYFPQEEILHLPHRDKQDSLVEQVDSLITDVAFMPNPVYTDLQVNYTLVRDARVYISVHYNGGVSTYQTSVHQEEEGFHSVTVNMAGMPVGAYVVYIYADDTVVSGSIIKL